MATTFGRQEQIVANPARGLVFFESSGDVYNYKTGQWTAVPGYADAESWFSVNSLSYDIGLVQSSGTAFDLQEQAITDPIVPPVIETAGTQLTQFGRSIIQGVRPLHQGGVAVVRVGVQDKVSDAVSYTVETAVNNRTGVANFRAEGHFLRFEVTFSTGVTLMHGIDVDFTPQGRV